VWGPLVLIERRHVPHPGGLLDAANRPLTGDIAPFFQSFANALSIASFSDNFIARG
jgi:hypothetical protein